MKKPLVFLFALLLCWHCASAESTVFVGEKYSISGSPYTLSILWPEGEEAPAQRELIQQIYFGSYPVMRELYGTTDATHVDIFLEHAPDSIAYTSNLGIFVSMEYLAAHPEDHNLLVHELFHIVQNGYVDTDPFVPALTEGLADYARATYASIPSGSWQLARYEEGQSYMDSYRVTGGFLSWIAQTRGETVLIRLNRALHEGRYTADIWAEYTGETLDDLWAAYAQQGR